MPLATDRIAPRLTLSWVNTDAQQAMFTDLVDGCLKGERRSQQRVYELFYGKMMAVCMRYTKNLSLIHI